MFKGVRTSFKADMKGDIPLQALERTRLVKITVREFLDDILNTNSMHIIVNRNGTYISLMHQ